MKLQTYAAYSDNDDVRKKSSSGGIFSLLASNFDVVYGVAMTDDCYGAHFVRAEKDISALRGSKYLQARVGDTFQKVKKDLEAGISVLFTGTGCQVNGLKKFLNKDYDNLFCVDVICHGVPSPALWKAYIHHREQALGERIQSVNFRCKEKGWKNFGMRENEVFSSKDTDPYMKMFLRDYCLRPSCYYCKAKDIKMADITIADFWGIDAVAPEMNDDKGISLVLVRTEKGRTLFEGLRGQLQCKEVSYEDGVRQNPAEYASVYRPKERDTFFEDMASLSFQQLAEKYSNPRKLSFFKKVKRKIKRILAKYKQKILRKRNGK